MHPAMHKGAIASFFSVEQYATAWFLPTAANVRPSKYQPILVSMADGGRLVS